MKRYFQKLFVFCSIITLSACSGFLDKEPLDQLTAGNFYKTVAEAELGVLGAYTPMQNIDYTGKGWMINEIPADNSQPGGTDPEFSPIDNFTVNADSPPVGAYWVQHYRQVALANAILSRIPGLEAGTQAQKDKLSAEAQFLRAIAYFDLVRIYGRVPLIDEPPSNDVDLLYPQSSINEIYALIKEDLSFAAQHLPVTWQGANLGRATKGAALALLAKVHLTIKEFGQARDRAKEVIDLGVYDLTFDFGENWDLNSCDNNEESVFQIQFTGCNAFGTGNPLQAFFAPWGEGITKDRDGWGSQIPTSSTTNNPGSTINDIYEEEDTRKHHTIMTRNAHYDNINPEDGGYTYPPNGASASNSNIKKYVVGSTSNVCFMSTPQNVNVIRYSDVLLTYAEALAEIQGGTTALPEALDAFNQVRIRAGVEPLTLIDRDIILEERRREFAFEGHRWFDLIRTGKALEIMTLHGKNIQPHNVLFPIPSSEMEINPNLVQNEGY